MIEPYPSLLGRLLSPFRIVIFFGVLVILAAFILTKLTVNVIPQSHSTDFKITFSWTGAPPILIEQQVTSVIENACSQLSDLKDINSISGHGYGMVTLEFDNRIEPSEKQREITALIRRIYKLFNPQVTYPEVNAVDKENLMQGPLVSYAVSSTGQPKDIRKLLQVQLSKNASYFTGVKRINLSAAPSDELILRFDRNKCLAYGLSPTSLLDALQLFFNHTYPGSFEGNDNQSLSLKVQNLHPLNVLALNIPVKTMSHQVVKLQDVADLKLEDNNPESYFHFNGKNAISIEFYSKKDINQLLTAQEIEAAIAEIKKSLPTEYHIDKQYDGTLAIGKEMGKNIKRAFISVLLLLVCIGAAYRNFGFCLLLIASLLITFSITLLFAWSIHIKFNLYTISGLAISFGLMIDNSIVMLDHYRKHQNLNTYTALLTTTCITAVALMMVFLLPEREKNNLIDFSLIIVISLIASLFTALFFIPGAFHYSRRWFPKPLDKKPSKVSRTKILLLHWYYKMVQGVVPYRKLIIPVFLLGFGLPLFLLPSKIDSSNWYNKLYNQTVGSDYYQTNLASPIARYTGGLLRLFVNNLSEKSGYRHQRSTKLYIAAKFPVGTTYSEVQNVFNQLEEMLSKVSGIANYSATIYNALGGMIEINFNKNLEKTSVPVQLKKKMIDVTADFGGIDWSIYGVGEGFSNAFESRQTNYTILVKGYNYEELSKQAVALGSRLIEHNRVANVNTNDKIDFDFQQGTGYNFTVDNNLAGQFFTTGAVMADRLSLLAYHANEATEVDIDGHRLPVILLEKNSSSFSKDDMLSTAIQTDSVHSVKMRNIGSMSPASFAPNIHRKNREYVRAITFDFKGSEFVAAHFIEEILADIKKQLPIGYNAERAINEEEIRTKGSSYALIGLVVVAVFAFSCVLFENIKVSFFVVFIILTSFIGVFIAFVTGDYYFDQGGYASFIMLTGLTASTSIFMVSDFLRMKRRRIYSSANIHNRFIVKTIYFRFGTLLLTSFSTCCGLVPFLFEGQNEIFWFSLSISTLAGIIFSLPMLLFILPVILWERSPNTENSIVLNDV